MASTLIAGGNNRVAVAWIDDEFVNAGVLVDRQDGVPRLAAIGGLVQAAVAARVPKWTLRCDEYRVGIVRVYPDLADVLGVLEAHVGPGLTAIH